MNRTTNCRCSENCQCLAGVGELCSVHAAPGEWLCLHIHLSYQLAAQNTVSQSSHISSVLPSWSFNNIHAVIQLHSALMKWIFYSVVGKTFLGSCHMLRAHAVNICSSLQLSLGHCSGCATLPGYRLHVFTINACIITVQLHPNEV